MKAIRHYPFDTIDLNIHKLSQTIRDKVEMKILMNIFIGIENIIQESSNSSLLPIRKIICNSRYNLH